ncbi:MAG: peptidoglycan DD-metalloendopeptidase family protein [Wenzhouxiangellaceae bacterium]|nr:peptidoglycan DD-metalloendopeptidase family protein [Wenzhouxiangellaceae bacterium]
MGAWLMRWTIEWRPSRSAQPAVRNAAASRSFPGFYALGACALLVWLAVPVSAADPEQIKTQLNELKQQIQKISDRLGLEREQKQSEQAALATAEKNLGELARELRTTRSALARTRQHEAELEDRASMLDLAITEQRGQLANQLAAAYRLGSRSRIRTLLSDADAGDVSRLLAMHGYLGRARIESVQVLQDRQARLEAVVAEQLGVRSRLEALAERQSTVLADQDQALARRQQALDELERTIASSEQRLSSLHVSAAELEALLEELADALADIPPEADITPFAELRGALSMPIQAPVTAGFSDARNNELSWQGWLISASVGDPVTAVGYGRIAYADWLRGYGMMVIIDHGDGFMTLYGRNQSLLAEVGDWVGPGEIIALAGNSGGGSEPGLYFQLRHNGRPIDPASWIAR